MEQALGGFSLSDQPLARAEIDVQPVQYGSLIGNGFVPDAQVTC